MSLLEVRAATVRFGGNIAMNRVELDVDPGSITGLIGPNGAGKTTTFNVITGLQPITEGTVHLDGRNITRTNPHKRAQLGIARTFQRLESFGSMTVRENVLVAAELRHRRERGDKSPEHVTDALLERMGLTEFAQETADRLPTGRARMVELARALATAPQLLLLDEPASGLDDSESDDLASLLTDLAAGGLAVLIVEHDVPLVMRVCSQVYVLDFGAIISNGTPAEVQADPVVQAAYLGQAGAVA